MIAEQKSALSACQIHTKKVLKIMRRYNIVRDMIFNTSFLIFVSTLFLSGINPSEVKASLEIQNGMQIDKIADGIYVATDKAYHNSRVLIVKLLDETVFIASSPFEDLGTESMMNWINKNLKPKKVIAINTHYHLDGISGNSVYHKYGVETWASDHTDRLHRKKGSRIRKSAAESFKDKQLSERILKTEITPAKFRFKESSGKNFELSGETIEVYFPGPSHSPDHVVVYFHKRKILFGGCMIKPGKTLGYLGDANVKEWVQSAKKLLRYDTRTVVPGHHKWGDTKLILRTIENAKKQAANIK